MMSLQELAATSVLVTADLLNNWVCGKPEDAIVGKSNAVGGCPVYEFLRETYDLHADITIYVYRGVVSLDGNSPDDSFYLNKNWLNSVAVAGIITATDKLAFMKSIPVTAGTFKQIVQGWVNHPSEAHLYEG